MLIKDLIKAVLILLGQIALLVLWLPCRLYILIDRLVYGIPEEELLEKPKKARKTKAEKEEEKEQALEKQFLDYGEMK